MGSFLPMHVGTFDNHPENRKKLIWGMLSLGEEIRYGSISKTKDKEECIFSWKLLCLFKHCHVIYRWSCSLHLHESPPFYFQKINIISGTSDRCWKLTIPYFVIREDVKHLPISLNFLPMKRVWHNLIIHDCFAIRSSLTWKKKLC